ncbi:methyl-accepting chemotaxis protein [Bradyrhizobium sp. SRS-191]|uniref:methyl-accepting chemotaxis protein n=1 Tax=Bradyrhizobium sp. SRS-191 TaxID=2962606 RepID=UPI00211EC3ED|nr:methyl-accepting chemotaxis protein [Bradyrhizobium sp. SRS-191]
MNNLKIRSKIIVLLLLLGLVSLGSVAYSGWSMKSIDTHYSDLVDHEDKAAVLSSRSGRILMAVLANAYSLAFESTDEGNARVLKELGDNQKLYLDQLDEIACLMPAFAAQVSSTQSAVRSAFDRCKPAIDQAASTSGEAATFAAGVALKKSCEPTMLGALATQRQLTELLQKTSAQGSDALTRETHQTIFTASAVTLAGLAVALLVSFMVSTSSISRPMAEVTGAIVRMAQNDFNVTLSQAARGDEIGELTKSSIELRQTLVRAREIEAAAAQQKQEAEQRRKSDMQQMATNFEAAVGNIVQTVSTASSDLERAATTLSRTADTTQSLSSTVAVASEQASANVQSVASATTEMSTSVSEIARQVQEASRIADEAVKHAEKTDGQISELSDAANRIGDVVKLITDIAGQTNLLALNATIEAARAGDAGRGFAVVAQEVKALAAQTASATGEISAQITAMQGATQNSVATIKEIGGIINRIAEISAAIAAAIEEQGAATQEIARNVDQAAQGTTQVASNITEVNRGAGETGAASSQVLTSAQSLSQESSRLKNELDRFLGQLRAA